MKRNLALLAAGTLMAGLLTGCGGGSGAGASTESYCDSMAAAKKTFSEFDNGDVAGLEDAINKFHELAAEAPAEVADAWQTLDGTMVALEDALAEAGLKISDLEAAANGELPDNVDLSKLADLTTELEKIGSDDVEAAAKSIEQHAKDECDVDLSDS